MRWLACAVALAAPLGLLAGCEDLPARDDPREPECSAGETETRIRYEEPSAPFGDECVMEEQTRRCAGGRWLGWAGSFEYAGCEVTEPRDCQNPDAAHGTTESRVRFETFEVPFGGECTSEEQSRSCYDGTWSAWSGDFTAAVCRVGDPAACTAPDSGHGTTDVRVRYKTATVPFGETCESEQQTRSCFNGTWSEWTGSFSFDNCMIDPPAACTDPDMPHGATDSRVRFLEPQAAVASCESEDQIRTCFDGTWSEWSGTYEFETCDSPALAALRILPSKPILDITESYRLRAIGTLVDGGEEDISDRVAWSSDDPATVAVSDAGVATGKSIGSATVRAAVEGLEASATAQVYRWRYGTLDRYPGHALDFGGDRTDRVTLGWVSDDAGTLLERTWEQGVWSSIATVASEGSDIVSLRAATNSRGDKHILWTKPTAADPDTFEVRARNFPFQGSAWSDISTLTSTGDDRRAPSVSVAHVGHSLATWFEAGTQAYAAFSVSGGWPSSGTSLTGHHSHASAVDAFGNGIILAAETQSSPTVSAVLRAYHYTAADDAVGAPTSVWETSTQGGVPEELASDVRLGMDAAGNAIVAWVRKLADQSAVMAARYDADTGWEPASVVFDAEASPVVLGNLSVHVSGIAALAFTSSFGGQGQRVFVATFAPASGWDVPTPLSGAGKDVSWADLIERETVATNYDGRVLAVWTEPDGGGGGTFWLVARRYDPDIGWGEPRIVAFGLSFSHESAFGVKDGWFVGYVRENTTETRIRNAAFRQF